MPRQTPLPESETAIGKRLMEARKDLLIPRTACALKLGISTDRLISYEFGRAKLPWPVGERFCVIFKVSFIWLYDGSGKKWWGGCVAIPDMITVPPHASFCAVVESLLKRAPDLRDFINSSGLAPNETPEGPFLNPDQVSEAMRFYRHRISLWLDKIAPKQAPDFLRELGALGDRLADKYRIHSTKEM